LDAGTRQARAVTGPLTRLAIVFTRTMRHIDPDKPDRVDLKKKFS
jgi:hypothetical protein